MIRLHFLNVGHGDCTIVEFPSGRLSMVDINIKQQFLGSELSEAAKELGFKTSGLGLQTYSYDGLSDSFKAAAGFSQLCNPLDYLADHFARQQIFRFIATHPHMDHLQGLADLIACRTILNFWYTAPGVEKPGFEESPYREEDWDAFQLLASGATATTAVSPKAFQDGHYWGDDEMEIWLPTAGIEALAVDKNEPNLASYVVAIKHGDSLIVLGGDADDVLWAWLDQQWEGQYPKVTVLKASHHGRRSGYHQPSVKAMSPDLTVVSVGKKPSTDASNLYAQYSKVLSTRYHGNIVVECDEDGTWRYESDRTRSDDGETTEAILASVMASLRRRGLKV